MSLDEDILKSEYKGVNKYLIIEELKIKKEELENIKLQISRCRNQYRSLIREEDDIIEIDLGYFQFYRRSRFKKAIKTGLILGLLLIPYAIGNYTSRNFKNYNYKIHTVKKGESLSLISKQYYGIYNNWKTIYKVNNLKTETIEPNDKLVIPVRK